MLELCIECCFMSIVDILDWFIPIILKTGLGGFGAAWGFAGPPAEPGPAGPAELDESAIVSDEGDYDNAPSQWQGQRQRRGRSAVRVRSKRKKSEARKKSGGSCHVICIQPTG